MSKLSSTRSSFSTTFFPSIEVSQAPAVLEWPAADERAEAQPKSARDNSGSLAGMTKDQIGTEEQFHVRRLKGSVVNAALAYPPLPGCYRCRTYTGHRLLVAVV